MAKEVYEKLDPTPMVATNAALDKTFDMKYLYEQMRMRAQFRDASFGLTQLSEDEIKDMMKDNGEEDEPDDEEIDPIESRAQRYAAADRRLALAHAAAKVREFNAQKESKAAQQQRERLEAAQRLIDEARERTELPKRNSAATGEGEGA